MAKQKYYVVWKGRQTGILPSWEACAASVTGYPGAEYKAFESEAAARAAFQREYESVKGRPASAGQWLLAPQPPVIPSICVDAACSGAPGPLEYRGVETESGRQIFRQGPFEDGTNNVGEFLAIVHALAWLQTRGLSMPIYSDSENAIAWVQDGRCRTRLARTGRNDSLFDLIARAEAWLSKYSPTAPILKWDTEAWGENPADFGRK
ncbi:MAG: ribonuclease H family protein [Anaerolineales bacterium]